MSALRTKTVFPQTEADLRVYGEFIASRYSKVENIAVQMPDTIITQLGTNFYVESEAH